ncbi:MAG: hypothetical protein IPM35_11680 [Myxococcales bacterium]|nr:hypothetical protein [Myxococcales bacterium]
MLERGRASLELASAPSETSLAFHAGLGERAQAGASVGAFDPTPAFDLKWRPLEAGPALRIGRAPGELHTQLIGSATFDRMGADLSSGLLARGAELVATSSVMLTLPAPGESLLAVEVGVEGRSSNDASVLGRAVVARPLLLGALVSLELAPRHSLGGGAELAATLGMLLTVDFPVSPQATGVEH